MLSRAVSPIWMDSSTGAECREIAAAVGGDASLAQHTGSRAFERFTGPQIRKFATHEPAAYARDRSDSPRQLVPRLAARRTPRADRSGRRLRHEPDGSRRRPRWWDAGGRGHRARTSQPSCRRSRQRLPSSGRWRRTGRSSYGFPAAHGRRLVGRQSVQPDRDRARPGRPARRFRSARATRSSGLMREPRVDSTGTGHVFGSPTGEFMGLTCFKNGSLARERVRERVEADVGRVLGHPRGHAGRAMAARPAAVVRAGDHAAGARRRACAVTDSTSTTATGTCAA